MSMPMSRISQSSAYLDKIALGCRLLEKVPAKIVLLLAHGVGQIRIDVREDLVEGIA